MTTEINLKEHNAEKIVAALMTGEVWLDGGYVSAIKDGENILIRLQLEDQKSQYAYNPDDAVKELRTHQKNLYNQANYGIYGFPGEGDDTLRSVSEAPSFALFG